MRLSHIINEATALDIFDAQLRKELDEAIGTKEDGLLAAGAAVEFYFMLGHYPSDDEIATHGRSIARLRYQGRIVRQLFTDGEGEDINLESASMNLDALEAAAERLRVTIREIGEDDEILKLSKSAETAAKQLGCDQTFLFQERRMIRIREILDPDLKRRIVEKLAERRGLSAGAVPEWYELDDADYVDLLNDLKEEDPDLEDPDEYRM
jgi:hypothetical protein